MNDDTDQRASGDLSESDMGLPIAELGDLRESPSHGFFGRIRNTIDRRRLGSDLSELGWSGLLVVFLQYVDVAYQSIGGKGRQERGDL